MILVHTFFRDNIKDVENPNFNKKLGDLTLEQLKMEKELKIFEALEQKVNNSSFSSTNTSVVNMLISTPQKIDKGLAKNKIIVEGILQFFNFFFYLL